MSIPTPTLGRYGDYSEYRIHEQKTTNILMVDGNVSTNSQLLEAGVNARVYDKGYWGFASSPDTSARNVELMQAQAFANAGTLSHFGRKKILTLPSAAYHGDQHRFGRAAMTESEVMELLETIHAYCKRKYPDLISVILRVHSDDDCKHVVTSVGSQATSWVQRAVLYYGFTMSDEHGKPVRVVSYISGKGSLADLDISMESLEPAFDTLYQHLQAKRVAVPARAGQHTVVLAPNLAGMLAHEAMGHPCEADIVLGGAATKDLLGKRVASEMITMVDFANTYNGEELMMPVYADDEGTPASDVIIIKNGILQQFMNSRETAVLTDSPATGNARAFSFGDEPLVRMRNTAILPGNSRLEDIIAGVEDGYYLMRTSNGQADTTTEFMFGITLGYEIKNGKLGRAIRDTSISGNAVKMLSSVDAVSNDMYWSCAGYCGKSQNMVTSMGGPALRAIAHLGGE